MASHFFTRIRSSSGHSSSSPISETNHVDKIDLNSPKLSSSLSFDSVSKNICLSPEPVLSQNDARLCESEEDWRNLCIKTQELSISNGKDSSKYMYEVDFKEDHLGILFTNYIDKKNKCHRIIVNSIVPHSEAELAATIHCGDILCSINETDIFHYDFENVIALINDQVRPVRLKFMKQQQKTENNHHLLLIPSDAPTLVSKTHNSLSIKWSKVHSASCYEIQIAKRIDYNFESWCTIETIFQDDVDVLEPFISFNSGTIHNLTSSSVYVVRIRCGNGESWGSYSLPSRCMETLEPNSLSKSSIMKIVAQDSSKKISFCQGKFHQIKESGLFYYKVLKKLSIRKEPSMSVNIERLCVDPGSIIQCDERVTNPNTTQVFVHLPDKNGWVVETTANGTRSLERLYGYGEILDSSNDIKNWIYRPSPPILHQMSHNSLLITWIGIEIATQYQIEYATNSMTSRWITVDDPITCGKSDHTINNLYPSTIYVARIRAGYKNPRTGEMQWGPFSKVSNSISTLDDIVSVKLKSDSCSILTSGENFIKSRSNSFTKVLNSASSVVNILKKSNSLRLKNEQK